MLDIMKMNSSITSLRFYIFHISLQFETVRLNLDYLLEINFLESTLYELFQGQLIFDC